MNREDGFLYHLSMTLPSPVSTSYDVLITFFLVVVHFLNSCYVLRVDTVAEK